MNDAIRLACERAERDFSGNRDGTFNSCGFSQHMMRIAGLQGQIDGLLVRALLTGRPDIQVLPGGSHYRLIDE